MKKYSTISLIILLLVALWTTGCRKYPRIVGNDQVTTEKRNLVSFNRIENQGSFNVFIRHDSLFTATVEAESNLIPYIRTIVNGNTLEIDTRENLQNNYPINVYVTTPVLHGANLSGSGIVEIDSIESENLDVVLSGSGTMRGEANTTYLLTRISGSGNISLYSITNNCDARISGSGNMDLTGETINSNFSISGSGNIQSYNYTQKECFAKISGSGSMYVNVSDYLDVVISGSGSVFYMGEPSLNVSISGSGNVIKQ
jgi:hypothetical protein